MSKRIHYIASLCALAIIVTVTTYWVQHRRIKNAEAQEVKESVALVASVVNNKDQLTQVVTIQQQIEKRQPLSDEQVEQLSSVIVGPPDSILKAKALAAAAVVARQGTLTTSQKGNLTQAATKSLNDSDYLTRAYCVNFLGVAGDSKAVSSLLSLLNDSNEVVRGVTKKTINKLQTSTSKP